MWYRRAQVNQQSFKEDPFNGPPMEEGETGWGLQLGHWLAAGGLPPDLHPSHSSPTPVLVCKEGFGMKTLELLSSPLLPCSWHTNEVRSLSWQQWINIQPWQLGRMEIDGEAEPCWCQWGMMRLGLLGPRGCFQSLPSQKMSGLWAFLLPLLPPADLYEHQAVCHGPSIFLATSEEVLSAQLEFLVCVWA